MSKHTREGRLTPPPAATDVAEHRDERVDLQERGNAASRPPPTTSTARTATSGFRTRGVAIGGNSDPPERELQRPDREPGDDERPDDPRQADDDRRHPGERQERQQRRWRSGEVDAGLVDGPRVGPADPRRRRGGIQAWHRCPTQTGVRRRTSGRRSPTGRRTLPGTIQVVRRRTNAQSIRSSHASIGASCRTRPSLRAVPMPLGTFGVWCHSAPGW